MDDVFVYLVDMPNNVHEFVTPCLDGYTVYIDNRLGYEGRMDAYAHAMKHILCGDFEKSYSVDMVETMAHQ